MYKVINKFMDKDGHVYEVGKPYPAEGKKLTKTRAEFLTKVHPEYDVAFLEFIEEKEDKKEVKTSKNKKTADEKGSDK
ncbi:hypothetical protein [Rummeliibacillus sp. TYF-LIM-RU47]|uniref:hypothetical protein n=1 Tax=Rummeliibacillus sp. TYF-LIM-RU47 TaxID=2608406 RepID=UPI001238D652|nr:hypothetical protein [Rummeliibacillus sp. TYF-LIM-RU47]